jgi:uncharacterized cupredoxin-like copper-binding protein
MKNITFSEYLSELKKHFNEKEYERCIHELEEHPIDEVAGGLADFAKPSEFNSKELRMGAEVEFEHTNEHMTAIQIAMDHLKEIADYYTRLMKMEKDAKGDAKKLAGAIR